MIGTFDAAFALLSPEALDVVMMTCLSQLHPARHALY